MRMNTLSYTQLASILGACAIALLTAGILGAWTGPTDTPPDGNVPSPINVGSITDRENIQTKNDQLSVYGLATDALAVFGNTILSGSSPRYINFGTTAGSAGYGLRDNSGIIEHKDSGGDWSSLNQATSSAVIDYQVFTTSGTWTKPSSGAVVFVQCWGGGGSGAARHQSGQQYGTAGGGGGYSQSAFPLSMLPASVAVTVGAGGVAPPVNTVGNSGGTSNFGSYMYAYGGQGASPNGWSDWSGGAGGSFKSPGGGEGGGKGGGPAYSLPTDRNGGSATYAGAGGAGFDSYYGAGTAGTSLVGGNGGAHLQNGGIPGGGAGGGQGNVLQGGSGARGECRLTTH